MKILINSYNVVTQNSSGGVQVRVNNYLKHVSAMVDIKLFDMWKDKIDDCDILHVFKANIDSYALMVQAKQKNKRIVLSSVIPQEKKAVIKHNLFWSKILRLQTGYLIIKKELDMADCIIAQTEKEKQFIIDNYNIQHNKIEVIPNGISVNFDEKNRFALEGKCNISKPYLLQVGRFDENKNQISIIKALKGTGIQTLFVGGPDPQSQEYYERCKEEAKGYDNFKFIGWLENGSPELQSAYMNAHAVILPSHKEIFGNSLIEGAAVGARLIGTKSLPLASMGIDKYCLQIDPNDIVNIRDKIMEAMNEKKIEHQADEVHSLFSWDAVAKRHYEIYRRILKHD